MSTLLAFIALILEIVYFAQTKSLELWFLALVVLTIAVLIGGYDEVRTFIGRRGPRA